MTRPKRHHCAILDRFDRPERCPTECPEYLGLLVPCHCGRLLVEMAAARGGFTATETATLLGIDPSRVRQIEANAVRKLQRNHHLQSLFKEAA